MSVETAIYETLEKATEINDIHLGLRSLEMLYQIGNEFRKAEEKQQAKYQRRKERMQ